MRVRDLFFFVKLMSVWPVAARAHVSEQGFVLLLPTDAYTAAGVAVVMLTVVALFVIPQGLVQPAFSIRRWRALTFGTFAVWSSLASLPGLIVLLWIGLSGPIDPLSNLMPLMFWILGWVCLVSLSGIAGTPWPWLNPWTGLLHLLRFKPLFRLPRAMGVWPSTLLLIGFSAFLLADIAPDDPARLARLVGFYWLFTFVGAVLCGPGWFRSMELGHTIFRAYGQLAAWRLRAPAGLGGPGWQSQVRPQPNGAGIFALTLLAMGSFDGLNETFWWLGRIGVNPLEFPGRSAIVWQTLAGIAMALFSLWIVFGTIVLLGLRLSSVRTPFWQAFEALALSLLPIAFVYHVAHYLPSFLVSIQYTFAAFGDPMARGADFLGLSQIRVTTGFFNRLDTVRIIWLM